MKIALVISGNDPETVWNAFRFGVFALEQGDAVGATNSAPSPPCGTCMRWWRRAIGC